jgi:hypothetical protein
MQALLKVVLGLAVAAACYFYFNKASSGVVVLLRGRGESESAATQFRLRQLQRNVGARYRVAYLRMKDDPNAQVVNQEASVHMHPGKEVSLPACTVTSGSVDMAYPEMGSVSRDDSVDLGVEKVASLRALPALVRWWKKCHGGVLDSIAKPEYVWVVDEDAYFIGNSSDFFATYDNETADVVAASLRQQEGEWWGRKYLMRWSVLGAGFENHTANATGKARVDVAEAAVVRYSSRALEMVAAALDQGAVAPEEAFATTLCTKSYGFGFLSSCKTLDFGPAFASPHFRAEPPYVMEARKGNSTPPHCTPAWKKRWVHPVVPGAGTVRISSYGCSNSTNLLRTTKFLSSRWKRMRGRMDNLTKFSKKAMKKREMRLKAMLNAKH